MTPPPERAELAAALREVRRRTGLSLTGLEERTPFSKSSWGRYLKGDTLPPRDAVRALCRLAGEPDGRCLALWEIAEAAAGSGRAAHAPADAPSRATERKEASAPPPPEGTNRNRSLRVAVAVAAGAAVLASAVTAAVVLTDGGAPDGSAGTAGTAPASPGAAVVPPPRCRGASCAGKDPINMLCGVHPDTLTTYRTAAAPAWNCATAPGAGRAGRACGPPRSATASNWSYPARPAPPR